MLPLKGPGTCCVQRGSTTEKIQPLAQGSGQRADDGVSGVGTNLAKEPGRSEPSREREMARSSFSYRREIAAQPGRVFGRRGPKTAASDAKLLEGTREVIDASPFYGEGHRKVWARLHFAQARTLKARVLRLMHEAGTLPKAGAAA